MIEAAEAVRSFVAGRARADLDHDRMLLFAVVRAMEIIGEAASKVTSETKSDASEIPWQPVIGMRNRLVHAYFDVNRDIIWKTATEEIPVLEALLRPLVTSP